MKNNFIQRAVTGVLFVVVLVGCILYSPLSFGILFTLISALSVYEFTHLMNQSGEVSINKAIAGLGGAYLFLALIPHIYNNLYIDYCHHTWLVHQYYTYPLL